jgi:hypothetical protein
MADWLGWLATAVVAASYIARRQATLRRIQGFGACMWGAYGMLIHSWPVVVANVIVASAALLTSLRVPAPEAITAKPES